MYGLLQLQLAAAEVYARGTWRLAAAKRCAFID